jgi:hypothetical protein
MAEVLLLPELFRAPHETIAFCTEFLHVALVAVIVLIIVTVVEVAISGEVFSVLLGPEKSVEPSWTWPTLQVQRLAL